jgi:glycosyltransferase involved in cell wall biosynthesis
LKILVSAIACTPIGGSEGAIGWNTVKLLAIEHEIRVLTCASQVDEWETAVREGEVGERIQVRFIGRNTPWNKNRMIARIQSWVRYLIFNRKVLAEAQKWHDEQPADLVHQITYATWRVPSPLWRMSIPFVWGPIGGTAVIPSPFLNMLSKSARLLEFVRVLQSLFAKRSAGFLNCIREASVVVAANDETEAFLLPLRNGKPLLQAPSSFISQDKIKRFSRPFFANSERLTLFAGGNIEGRKGVSLAIRALAKVRDAGIDFHYTVAGGGPEIGKLKELAAQLDLSDKIEFHPGYQGDDFVKALQAADIYLLPSFRETTPVTLQEAILAGCYPIVADASAAGEMTRIAGGCAIRADTPDEMIDGLADALIRAAGDVPKIQEIAKQAAINVANHFAEDRYYQIISEAYEIALKRSSSIS